LLENEILQQVGENSPQRLCVELTAFREDYLRNPTDIRRAIDNENGYLRQTVHGGQPLPAGVGDDDILGLSEERPSR
jgi:hypothetical protein